MKKSILFVLHRIGIGGSMTSMLNLLELLKAQGYEIDLFLMEHEGAYLGRAKESTKLLREDVVLASVLCNKEKLIKTKNPSKLFIRLSYVLAHNLFGAKRVKALVYRWRAKKIKNKYDNVIAFQENTTTDFVQHIQAKNKIAWVHTNYERFATNEKIGEMQKVYDNFDKIVCVSKVSKQSIITNLKNLEKKTHVVYNSLNYEYILKKSDEYTFATDKSVLNFLSVGRFVEAKRFDRIIKVSRKLVDSGLKFRWYIVGDGELYNDIKQMIKVESLENIVILLGAQTNPYPIFKAVDYVVITSLYEAHPMTAIEGLVLHKPVISTAFSSVYEVINNKKNGLICKNSYDEIYKGIKEITEEENLSKVIRKGAGAYTYSNEKILLQFSELLL
ncbi:glycosyltransferase [Peribacillus butanolivorans]|uniref:glycosyltransferase n=1 Tax=Peribacillus butanolivorans TaxID=421767 RepID=UPI0036B37588